jgi:polyisoprenoid-binding protein YceI
MLRQLFVTAAAISIALPALASVKKVAVNPTESKVTWKAEKKAMAGHTGTIAIKTADVKIENGMIAKGSTLAMDMGSITVTDIPATQKENGELLGHLKSDDFFGVAKNPEAKLVVQSSKVTTPGTLEVTGDLTIKGQTLPITFPVTMTEKDGKTVATGKMVVDRVKYGIKYNSENVFKNLVANKVIKDQFEINFNLIGTTATK